MPLTHDKDIQIHLPVDKFLLADMPDDLAQAKLDTERVIRGRLSGVFTPLTLAAWTTYSSTPEYIRAIAGRLTASLLYALRLAEDYPDDADYFRRKYREGMSMLEMVADGTVVMPEVLEIVDTGQRLTENNFVELPPPKFTMDMEF
jgi:hypothetical protein